MAIPTGTKFRGVAPYVETKNLGSTQSNDMRDVYTIEEIRETSQSIIVPEFITVGPGTSSSITTDKNIIDITWVGGSGTHVLYLPSATAIPYRFLRIVNNSTVTAADKVEVTTVLGETIDGSSSYEINKPYNGIAVWSDGTNWTVIQAKSS